MTAEHAIVYAKAFSSVPSMLKMLGNKSSSYVKLEQGVSKISKNGIEVVAEDLTTVKVESSNNKNTVTQIGKNSKEVVLYEDKNSKITVDVEDVFIEDTVTKKSVNASQQVNKGTTSNNPKVNVTTKTTEGKNKTTNTSSYVTGIKEDEPNTFLNGKKFEVIEATEGEIESIKELSTDEENKTVKELHEIAEKEGLNPTPRKNISGTGEGQKFQVPNYDGKGIKIIGIRSDSGGTHNMDYIRIDTNQGSTKVIFGDPKKYKYNMTNKEKGTIIFVIENKNKKR